MTTMRVDQSSLSASVSSDVRTATIVDVESESDVEKVKQMSESQHLQ